MSHPSYELTEENKKEKVCLGMIKEKLTAIIRFGDVI